MRILTGFLIMLCLVAPVNLGAASKKGQSAMSGGTSVSGAVTNTLVSGECQTKYNACIDAFCMLDNVSGGRCLCSNKNAELDSLAQELDQMDMSSAMLATTGVNLLETKTSVASKVSAKSGVDLSLWNTVPEDDDSDNQSELAGDALFASAHAQCATRISECADDMVMLRAVYSSAIKSDCMAYENAIKSRQTTSLKKKTEAESAMRSVALAQYTNANKYDLGQCTLEYRKCMQTTAGCKDDFSGCVASIDAGAKDIPIYTITGEMALFDIYQETYDLLDAKRPLCDDILSSCNNVASQVWPAFLASVGNTLRMAELRIEDNNRQDCVGSVSECFLNACKDNIDPNNPDGSYDMCLTRPETMLSFCKVQLNACGIDATSRITAEKSKIWDFVIARLASMRVNSCTKEVKECLTSADRCGADWSGCVGLSTDNILRLCPYDKMLGCQKQYGDDKIRDDYVYEELYSLVQGTMVNIDDALLSRCQAALDTSMTRVCGSADDCNSTILTDTMGAESLSYHMCVFEFKENQLSVDYSLCWANGDLIPDVLVGRSEGSKSGATGYVAPLMGLIEGTVYWSNVEFDDEGRLKGVEDYLEKSGLGELSKVERERVENELNGVQRNIDKIVTAIESDQIVQYCMTGRNLPIDAVGFDNTRTPRFPNLTKNMRMRVATAALKKARENYYKKYDSILEQQTKDYVTIGTKIAENTQKNNDDAKREIARNACVNLAEQSALPKSKTPSSATGQIIVAVVLAEKNNATNSGKAEMTGHKIVDQWNYEQVIDTEFNPRTMVCTKCIREKQCIESHDPVFGKWKCKKWGEQSGPSCNDIQF